MTFTATVMGNAGTPTGTIAFRDNGAAIAGCAPVALANGKATCTTSGLAGGTHPITGLYSGNATYSSGVAGPITQTVKGSVATRLAIDSSRYTSTAGQSVTLTVKVTGNGTAAGSVNFQDNGSSIAGCASIALDATGTGTCTTSSPRARQPRDQGTLFGQLRPRRRRPDHADRQLTAVHTSRRDVVQS